MKRIARLLAAALIAVAAATGCVTEPPGNDFVENVNNDFQENDYFNP